ncbi:hypothetical protein [Castellaniella sp.]|uniref:hypothetical protein n=1 Tax=Castellaniella sp. TaxID=1955812 RepID=UPI002AFEBE6A|nr:hypothetical protein [Castellaniella sp.]
MSSDFSPEVPVLLLLFNRVDCAERLLSLLKSVGPRKIYVSCDGPRLGNHNDVFAVNAIKEKVLTSNWKGGIEVLFREDNLGCRKAVSGAIDWFFENEESGIILEDDCVPDLTFFSFCKEMLEKYRHDERVMGIGGQNYFSNKDFQYSYIFTKYNQTSGWATWKRAWKHYDRDMANWPSLRNSDWLLSIGSGGKVFASYWKSIFDKAYEDKDFSSWAYRWTFSCWAQRGLSILPTKNLVINVGIGDNATHTKNDDHPIFRLSLEEMSFPLSHPPIIALSPIRETWLDVNVYRITYKSYVKSILIKNRSTRWISSLYGFMANIVRRARIRCSMLR